MKPTRKVQAQRKFAQGAYTPAVASTSAFQERKTELPKEEYRNVVRNNVPAKVLLDIVSFKNLHLHMQPIVLIERLKSPTLNRNNTHKKPLKEPAAKPKDRKEAIALRKETISIRTQERVTRIRKHHPKLPRRCSRAWDMTLRSRSEPNTSDKKAPEKSLRKRRVTFEPPDKIKRKRNITRKENFTSDDNKPLTFFTKTGGKNPRIDSKSRRQKKPIKTIVNKGTLPNLRYRKTKNIKVNNIQHVVNRVVRKNTSRQPKHTPTQIKNQEKILDYQVSKETEIRDSADEPRQGTEMSVDNDPIASISIGIKVPPHEDIIADNTQSQSEPQPGPSGVQTTVNSNRDQIIAPVTEPVKFSNTPEPQPGPSGVHTLNNCKGGKILSTRAEPAESTITSGLFSVSGYSYLQNDPAPYYNEHGIQQWIKGSLPAPQCAPDTDEIITPLELTPASCPANAWSTLREVVNAPSQDLETRCTKCKTCSKIDKLFKLSSLLKAQRKIECNYESHTVSEAHSRENTMMSPEVDNEHIYMELLPSHPHLMVKLKVHQIHDKQILSARLISRRDARLGNEFMLVEHEYLVDQLIGMLTVSLGDSCTTFKMPVDNPVVVDLTQDKCSVNSGDKSDAESPADSFPKSADSAKLLDAPVFRPTKEEFNDPISYIEKIAPFASKYGICKVIPPPKFTPKCKIDDEIRFDVINQYISRLYSRWGPAARELCAIKACLKTQSLNLNRSPLLDGMEVNLPKLYHLVQRNGGLEKVINKNRWSRVAEEMRFTKAPNPEKKLDNIYVKYLLPYDTLAHKERQEIIRKVEKYWNKRNQKMLDRALNPLHRQKRLLGESDSSGEDTGDESEVGNALAEAEDCVVPGSCMNLSKFKRVASIALENNFRSTSYPSPMAVEDEYWRLVLLGAEHVCVNTASIDTGEEGYGFSKSKQDPYSRHPWNLKMLSQNSGNVLRSLGPVLGVTVPTLHLGMVFSTSCWHRDPHALPWLEYMHQGPPKIWYGIPDEQSRNFRKAVETLCPTSCQNKSIWLPSDITMIPPNLLLEHNVSLSKIVQEPGEFVIVFPKAYSCSICTGYTQSESVYFATNSWLHSVHQVFQEVRDSCEPTMFSLEQLLLAVAQDSRSSRDALQQVHESFSAIVREELDSRARLEARNLPFIEDRTREYIANKKRRSTGAWNVRDLDECEVCRMTLYLSKVSGLTGKKSSVCLQHALRLLETNKHRDVNLSNVEVVIYVPSKDLKYVIDLVQKRLSSSSGL